MVFFMKIIKSNCGKEIIVDDFDYELFKFMKWNIDYRGYARTYCTIKIKKGYYKTKTHHMHRFFFKSNDSLVMDHINRNILDNRRSNLRLVSRAVNALNTEYNLGDERGVRKRFNKWICSVSVKNKSKYLGSFNSKEEASEHRKKFINMLHKIDL